MREPGKLFGRLEKIGFASCLISNNQEARVKMFNKDIQTNYIYNAHKPSTKNYNPGHGDHGNDQRNDAFCRRSALYGCVGAKRAGIHNILVRPIHPKEEIQIVLKRYLEKVVLHFIQKRRKKRQKAGR